MEPTTKVSGPIGDALFSSSDTKVIRYLPSVPLIDTHFWGVRCIAQATLAFTVYQPPTGFHEHPRISAYTLYFLETIIIGLYFAADNIGIFSLKFFMAGSVKFVYFCNT